MSAPLLPGARFGCPSAGLEAALFLGGIVFLQFVVVGLVSYSWKFLSGYTFKSMGTFTFLAISFHYHRRFAHLQRQGGICVPKAQIIYRKIRGWRERWLPY
jgi:hypothetical protein